MKQILQNILESGVVALIAFIIGLCVILLALGTFFTKVIMNGFRLQVLNFMKENNFQDEQIIQIHTQILELNTLDISIFFLSSVLFFICLYFLYIYFDRFFLALTKNRKIQAVTMSEVFEILQIKSIYQKEDWLKTSPIKIYISNSDLESSFEEYIFAKVYVFNKLAFNSLSFIKKCLVENKLCVDKSEFEKYLTEMSEKYGDGQENKYKKACLLLEEKDRQLSELQTEIKLLSKKSQTLKGRETNAKNNATKGFFIGKIYHEFMRYLLINSKENSIDDAHIKEKLFEFLKSEENIFHVLAETKTNKNLEEIEAKDIIPSEIIPYIKSELGVFAKRRGRPKG